MSTDVFFRHILLDLDFTDLSFLPLVAIIADTYNPYKVETATFSFLFSAAIFFLKKEIFQNFSFKL